MALYSSPPPARTPQDDKPTLLVCWWCSLFAAVIILFRVTGRFIRSERLFKEDWLAFATVIPLAIRMALVHVILIYGTNNVITTGLTPDEINKREIGSKLVLASRIFYAATLWMLKLTITEFFKRLTVTIWRRSYEYILQFIRWFLLITFIAIVISDLVECHPTVHYWQVVPDPGGQCRQGYAQLLTMGTVNVITDILLVIFPIPIIIRSSMGFKRKAQLVALFSASLLPVGTTLYRLPNVINRHGSQQYRSLLASVEILFAAAVANALILGSFVRDKGVKKHRWKLGSQSDSVERTTSRRGTATNHWGSDEDLVRDLGIGLDPKLRGSVAWNVPRPAPMAVAGNIPVKKGQPDWAFPPQRRDSDDDLDFIDRPDGAGDIPGAPRKVSFFDVGGLLEEDMPPRASTGRTDTDGEGSTTPGRADRSWYHDDAGLSPPPAPKRGGSAALLQDLGGLLGSKPKDITPPRSYELQTMVHANPPYDAIAPHELSRQKTEISLQDVGGLLN
ncbi:hypothetical protein OIDMADRAFT_188358 [Oidiodendron maius Zn]|uniref:Rhodopsin domain-containing protein n=1 Tax=Oidiodendron maius (strain Zn) TaxID=913774 RepID=A0A0C3HKF3_OIDMZ|nr:hypothetical protein OIDMADRAFT_188358 [Oidiodendron maius Zn]